MCVDWIVGLIRFEADECDNEVDNKVGDGVIVMVRSTMYIHHDR